MSKLLINKTIINMPVQTTDYIIGSNLLANLHKLKQFRKNNYSSFLLLSDRSIFNLYGEKVVTSLRKLDKPVITSLIEPGEKYKDLSVIEKIVQPYFQHGFDRNTALVALGGGVITDLGGFIASILLRGIDAVYLPSTLLCQIDAAIGGKTGVDLSLSDGIMLKNMLGTIVQPKIVISDVDTLLTLPKKEILNGLGEMTKYWAGWGIPTIRQLNTIASLASTPGVERDELIKIVSICQEIKINIVQKDPYEKLGLRQKLNLGHTIGHAIEGSSADKICHGQAVAIGLAAISKLSVLKGLLTKNTYNQIIMQLKKLGLPTTISGIEKQKVLQVLKHDKKGGTFVLIKDIGKLQTGVRVETELIEKVLAEVIL